MAKRGTQERSTPQTEKVAMSITPTWPEMRIIRQANTDRGSYHTDTWREFLDDLGHRNYGKGKAHSLGSLAIVYVPARDMGRMLQEKYPKIYMNRARTIKLQRSLAETVRLFVRDSHAAAYDKETDNLELSNFRVRAALGSFSMSNELETDEPLTYEVPAGRLLADDQDPAELDGFDPDRPGMSSNSQIAFSDTRLKVTGMDVYGKDGIGLNLTENEMLYDERSRFIKFLGRDEGLNTRGLNQGWSAHATVFTYEQHINASIINHKLDVPGRIVFDAPRAHVS
jgi:hypothetical protein